MKRTLKFFVISALLCLQNGICDAAGVIINGTSVSSCHPESGEFLCKSGHECIHASQVCDRHDDCTDGSDEFTDCEKSSCSGVCEHGCMPINTEEKKGICFCNAGFKVSGPNKESCVNVNECIENFGACSQKCRDTPGSFECSCLDGFNLLPNNSTCVPKAPDAKLIFALKSSVRVLSLTSPSAQVKTLVEKMGQTVGVAFDAEGEDIFWTDVSDRMEAIYRSKVDGTEVKAIVDTGLNLPESIAYDWIARNIYFTDSNLTHVGVCDRDGKSCTILVQEQIDKPREIVLHPATGKMFWTDWGSTPAIVSAGMDGSSPFPIITGGLKWPNGLAIDHGTSRIYWIDANVNMIETSDLEGGDRRIVKTTGIKHPFSMEIFADTLYWSDWTRHQIESCNKFTGDDHQVVFDYPRDQINGIAVFHRAAQPKHRPNDCEDHQCSHICVLTPVTSVQKFRCLCPVGMTLRSDKKTCKDDPKKPKLFMAEGANLKSMHFHAIGHDVLTTTQIDGIHTIGSIAYNPLNSTYIIFDNMRKILFSYNPSNNKLEAIISRHMNSVRGIDIDVIGHNIYWVDASKQTLEVMSLKTGARAILYHQTTYRPFDVIVVPEVKSLFVSLVGRGEGQILRMSMDGVHIEVILHLPDGEPTALAYNHDLEHIIWCDPLKGTIEHASIDGRTRFLARSNLGAPYSLAAAGNRVFWSDRYTQLLSSFVIGTDIQDTPIFIGDEKDRSNVSIRGNFYAAIGVKNNDLSDLNDLLDHHECSPDAKNTSMPCSHICLLSDKTNRATCYCPDGMELKEDNKTCIPLKTCLMSQFTCNDGACISSQYRCDNFRDCSSGEDELNCTIQSTCRVSDFVCRTDQACIPNVWKCDGEHDCHDQSDEENCPDRPCPNPSDFRCKLGRCIPQSWRCDHVVDCPDKDDSDELSCNFTCRPGEFKCKSQDCIQMDWVCDGEDDCGDGSDEHNDCDNPCKQDEFKCMNHKCIRRSRVCNSRDDCGDNSDEAQCPLGVFFPDPGFRSSNSTIRGTTIPFNTTTTVAPFQRTPKCSPEKFLCFTGECIEFSKVCNGRFDCLDGSDESDDCQSACGVANECSHVCNRTPQGPVCSCQPGYRLTADMKSCEDIDECKENICGHYCVNVKGSYKCSCHDEYVLKSDHKTCKAKGHPPLFIYEWNSKVYIAPQDLMTSTEIPVEPVLSGLDINSHNGDIYWANGRKGVIGRSNVDPKKKTEILFKKLAIPSHLAYDWISNNIFVVTNTNPGRDKRRNLVIKICSVHKDLEKRLCATLHQLVGQEVTDLAVAPQEQSIFWTEVTYTGFGTSVGAIRMGKMDSPQTTTLASEGVINPAGLAVDHVFKRVYWIDRQTRKVEVVNFNGRRRRVIISSGVSPKVSGLAIFENWVMWSDDGKNVRCRTDMQGDCMRVRVQNITDARHFKLLQQSLQPTGRDPCANNSCSFICTGTTSVLSTKNYTCFCPDGYSSENPNLSPCHKDQVRTGVPGNGTPRSKSGKPTTVSQDNNSDNDIPEDEIPRDIAQQTAISTDSNSTTAIVVTGVVSILIICLVAAAVIFYRKRGPPKIFVRPYVQQWVKYVNDPVQRWRDNRREPLTSHDAYADVYETGGSTTSEHNYTNPCYDDLDPPSGAVNPGDGSRKAEQKSGILNLANGDYENQLRDGHYISYSQRDKLLDNEFV